MSALFTAARKQLVESRWFLALLAAGLFGLSWLFVFVASRIESEQRRETNVVSSLRRAEFVRRMGGPAADFSTTSIELALWRHPFIMLMILTWSIGRGTLAVAGEIERGTLDLIMSRPVSRSAYLFSQVLVALAGIALLAVALIVGNLVGTRYNAVDTPPGLLRLGRGALALAALAFSVYGYSLFFSALDSVRWRANMFASALSIAMYVAWVLATIPSLNNLQWLEHWSIFTACDPVEAAIKAENLAFNVSVLGGLGLGFIVAAFVAFNLRDLPANS